MPPMMIRLNVLRPLLQFAFASIFLMLATGAFAECPARRYSTKMHELRTDYLNSIDGSCPYQERLSRLNAWAKQQDIIADLASPIWAKHALEISRAYADDLGQSCKAVEREFGFGGHRRIARNLSSSEASETTRWLTQCIPTFKSRLHRLDLIERAARSYKRRTNMFAGLACRKTGNNCGPIDKGFEAPARALVDIFQKQVDPPEREIRKIAAIIEEDPALRATWLEVYELFERSHPERSRFRFSSGCRAKLGRMEGTEFEFSWARLVSGAREKTVCVASR
jgi:hypothetical protein